jgi:hypothetical protein
MNLQYTHSATPAVTRCNKPPPVFPWQSWSQRMESSDGNYKSVPIPPTSCVPDVCVHKQGHRYVNTERGVIHLCFQPCSVCCLGFHTVFRRIERAWPFVQSKQAGGSVTPADTDILFSFLLGKKKISCLKLHWWCWWFILQAGPLLCPNWSFIYGSVDFKQRPSAFQHSKERCTCHRANHVREREEDRAWGRVKDKSEPKCHKLIWGKRKWKAKREQPTVHPSLVLERWI